MERTRHAESSKEGKTGAHALLVGVDGVRQSSFVGASCSVKEKRHPSFSGVTVRAAARKGEKKSGSRRRRPRGCGIGLWGRAGRGEERLELESKNVRSG
jgi:hypothetical protein